MTCCANTSTQSYHCGGDSPVMVGFPRTDLLDLVELYL